MVVTCQDEKSQLQNKERALKILRARLKEAEEEKQMSEQTERRRMQIGTGDRSERIRTYNYPQGRVTDHRINLTLYKLDEILEGDLDRLIDPLKSADNEKKIEKIGAYLQTWNVKSILDWAINYFKNKNIPQPRLSAELLLSSVLNLNRINLYLNYNRILNQQELGIYKKYILKRLEHVPIQYILKEAYFRKIKLYVDSGVLIPRPETELIVERAFQLLKGNLDRGKINILEIGTGSGAVAISIAYEIGKELKISDSSWQIIATENNTDVLEIAENNAKSILDGSKFENIKFIECDLVPEKDSDFFKQYEKKINIVISNPPYISEEDYKNLPREVKEYEPKSALLAGKTGLEVYEKILSKIKSYLSSDLCYILFEIDPKVSIPLKEMSEDIVSPKAIIVEKDHNQRDCEWNVKIFFYVPVGN
ncbi:Release factor glutamine methyltransferase [subsurface metagenome]